MLNVLGSKRMHDFTPHLIYTRAIEFGRFLDAQKNYRFQQFFQQPLKTLLIKIKMLTRKSFDYYYVAYPFS